MLTITPFQVCTLIIGCCFLMGCQEKQVEEKTTPKEIISAPQSKSKLYVLDSIFEMHKEYTSMTFDFPVGKPTSKGYYNAQEFRENDHLGEDWNGVGGGNSDLGDPIYSISNGYIHSSKNIGGGWGNVIRIIHSHKNKYYESIYAHCDTIFVEEHQFIKRGEKIGTIGTANGSYLAHLHLELRDSIFMDIGAGYSTHTKGYINPTEFIKTH
ncbi:M23 family metallopeptidase [uncultured Dokdonia sp.]|uniref:M23 family metallopeptidase n=1 Tax=uncultured Dokdonia sp. TaxID=575653 RepID=UPI00260D3512|nr:M23 family metallopeptidase [uncultured Dokdonia sp.]